MELPITPGDPIRIAARVYGPTGGVRDVEGMLDTGSLLMTVRPAVAAAVGYVLDDAPDVEVVTANGVTRAPFITLTRVSIGEFRVTNIPAVCLDIDVAGASSLLGLSLLSRLNVSLDHKAGALTITDP